MYDSNTCRRCRSPNTTTWSRHSRRIEPISLSAYPFCHGERGAVGRSRMPIDRSLRMKRSRQTIFDTDFADQCQRRQQFQQAGVMCVVETAGPVGRKGHDVPLAERMVQRPRHIFGQAFRPHLVIDGVLAAQRGIAFEILAYLGGPLMDFVGGTIDIFGSLPDIVVDPRKLGLAHAVGPHDPAAKPLRMVDHDMKRCPLDRYARLLEPDTHFTENIVKEALIARVVCQPAHDVAIRMRGDEIDVWRRVHILLGAVTWIDDAGYVMSP